MKMASNRMQSTGIFVVLYLVLKIGHALDSPPVIERQSSSQQIIAEVGDTMQLPCQVNATDRPIVSYNWTLNDRTFSPDNNIVVMLPNSGTLKFTIFKREYAGFYKCFATNNLGTAVSNTVHLIDAKLDAFSHVVSSPISKNAGESLRINCPRPRSVPDGDFYWSKFQSGQQINVDYNERILPDPHGGLNFAYVIPSDEGQYRCWVHNRVMRRAVRSQPFNITIIGDVYGVISLPAKTLWKPASGMTLIRGQPASISCLYAGKPVPTIQWSRLDGWPISANTELRRNNSELHFNSIEYSDAGVYQCSGSNSVSVEALIPPINTQINVNVFGHLRWVMKPQPITRREGDTVTFTCKGEGRPAPDPPKWYMNGVEVTGSFGNRVIGECYGPSTTFTISNITAEQDIMAIQCNITNRISWIHNSFYLNVLDESSDDDLLSNLNNDTYSQPCIPLPATPLATTADETLINVPTASYSITREFSTTPKASGSETQPSTGDTTDSGASKIYFSSLLLAVLVTIGDL